MTQTLAKPLATTIQRVLGRELVQELAQEQEVERKLQRLHQRRKSRAAPPSEAVPPSLVEVSQTTRQTKQSECRPRATAMHWSLNELCRPSYPTMQNCDGA